MVVTLGGLASTPQAWSKKLAGLWSWARAAVGGGSGISYTGMSQMLSAVSNMALAVTVARSYGVATLGVLSPAIAVGQIGLGIWRVGFLEVALIAPNSRRVLAARNKCWIALIGSSAILVVSLGSNMLSKSEGYLSALLLPALILALGLPFDLARYQHFANNKPVWSAALDGAWALLLLGTFSTASPRLWFGAVVGLQMCVTIKLFSKSGPSIRVSRELVLTARRQVEGFLWGFVPAALLAPLLLFFAGPVIAGSSRVVLLFVGPLGVLYSTLAILFLPKLSRLKYISQRVRAGTVLALVVPALVYCLAFLVLPKQVFVKVLGEEAGELVVNHKLIIGMIIVAKSLDLPGSILTRSRSGVERFIRMRRFNGIFAFLGLPFTVVAAQIGVGAFLATFFGLILIAGCVWIWVALTLRDVNDSYRGTSDVLV